MANFALIPIDFPNNPEVETPWTDPNGQKWVWNDFGWVREKKFTDSITDMEIGATGQFVRRNAIWSLSVPSKRYYGARATQPITRNDGSAPRAGDAYFDTVLGVEILFDGSQWRKYGQAFKVQNLEGFVWSGLTLINGDTLSKIDTNGKSLPDFLRQEVTEIILFADGLRLIETVPDRTGDYSVDYITSTITIDNASKFPVAAIIELRLITIEHRKLFVYPYTKALTYPGTGSNIFSIEGGNFDQDSKVISENGLNNIIVTEVLSDKLISFTIVTSPYKSDTLRVVNGNNRQSFGNIIQLNTSPSGGS